MGKIRELKDELEQLSWDDPRVLELQTEINKTEQWCIDNKPEYGVTLTKWTTSLGGGNDKYPWKTGFVNIRDIKMVGELNGSGIDFNKDGSVYHGTK